MVYIETLEAKKKALQEQQEQVDQLIEAEKAKQKQDRQINLRGLFNRMDSLIKTCGSSFSEESIGEIYELGSDLHSANSYSRTIDVELSGRVLESEEIYNTPLSRLPTVGSWDYPTLVVSFLIPFDMAADDPFFE